MRGNFRWVSQLETECLQTAINGHSANEGCFSNASTALAQGSVGRCSEKPNPEITLFGD